MTADNPQNPPALVKNDNTSHSSEQALARLEHYRKAYLSIVPPNNFDCELWKAVKCVDASMNPDGKTGKATFSLITPARYSNYTGNVMGGAVATILDGATNCSIALVARKGYWDRSGNTRNLSVTYVRPVKQGDELLIECEILRVTPLLVTIQGQLKRASDKKLLAVCVQEMVAIRANL